MGAEPHASSVPAKRGEPHTDQENIDVEMLNGTRYIPYVSTARYVGTATLARGRFSNPIFGHTVKPGVDGVLLLDIFQRDLSPHLLFWVFSDVSKNEIRGTLTCCG